ncbi:MAG: hypothetical protein L3K26_01865, partial [Candidatus Hydrogenedentes bacterium]|nr:hypothetical protein [Candidatus Hydrogenedentota bacterium]
MRGKVTFTSNDAPLFFVLAIFLLISVQGWSQEVKTVGISDISGHVEMGLKYREDVRVRDSVESSSLTDEMRLHQQIRLNVDGYIVHPRFLEFFLGPEFEYFQQQTSALGFGDQKINDLLVGGDFRLTLLREHPYSVGLYANRTETDVDRLFTRGFVTTRTTWGAKAGVRKGPVPFTIDYNHTELSSTDSSAGIDEVSDQLRLNGRYKLGRMSSGDVWYTYIMTDQQSFGRVVEEHRLTATNVSFFGEEKKRRLAGSIRASQQSGAFESTSFNVQEAFFWKHSPRLSTTYSVNFDRTETDGTEVDVYSAGFILD